MRRVLAALLFCVPAGAVLADIQAGHWQMTVTTVIEGMPGAMAPITQARCLTEAEAKDPSRLIGQGAGCVFSNRQDTGSQITFDVVCTGQVPLSGGGAVRYTPQTVEGTLDLTATNPRIVTHSQLAAKRLGECQP
jgi:hypothetical protein